MLLGLVGMAAMGGCAETADGPIDYRVTGGFSGNGDGTALHVDPDGTATKKSEGTERTVRLDPQTTADLYAKVRAAGFTSLSPVYECDCVDDFIHVITVELDGTDHTVSASMEAEIPERLGTLITTLHTLATLD